ncbi:PepSY domain-containing protein [Dinoroseobacter sp. S76]|uniref:PepSY domain-containing protein n=1 Tax=Dinoroseobacter sp. S76 TaxID=3415124 RepID=UPI003C7B4582
MTHPWLPTAAAAALISSLGVAAMAQSTAEPPLASPLTFDAAIAIALAEADGTIVEVALDRLDGIVVIDIEVAQADGTEAEFQLNAQTGEIVASMIDENPADDPGAGDTAD